MGDMSDYKLKQRRRIAAYLSCPRLLDLNPHAIAMEERWRQSMEAKKHPTSTSDQSTEIIDISSDSELESQRPSSSDLDITHKVFLSHSGAQKHFVKKLCADLKAENHCPFFDEEQSSLPKGEDFVPLILNATKHCRIAVVVLSEEYLTSKWPMLELVEFVKARESHNKFLKLLPLFYNLSVGDICNPLNKSRWTEAWKSFAQNDGRVNLNDWTMAFKALRRVNGLEFKNCGQSEKEYREAVVKEILGLSPSDLLYDTSNWEGCYRICTKLSKMFSTNGGQSGIQKLGLYGMGGVGKTTMGKALCNYFQRDFFGRVCHVELGSEDALILQKRVLKRLAHLGDEELHQIADCLVGSTYLKQRLHQHPVFLVIDNVSDEQAFRQEAGAYLEAGFHEGSRIMVTSRSQDVVKDLLHDQKYCKQMPDLMKDEAAVIFLQKAAPKREMSTLSLEEQSIHDTCLSQCYFYHQEDASSQKRRWHGQYHPLALIALGAYYNGISNSDLLSWKPHIEDSDKLKNSRESSDIFQILGLQFSTFERSTKLLFLDTAIWTKNVHHGFKNQMLEPQSWIPWLAAIHEMREGEVEVKLNHLKRSGIINFGEKITIHDLYWEFAHWYLSVGGLSASDVWCVYQTQPSTCLPRQLERHPPGKCWPDLSRVLLHELNCNNFPRRKLQEWCNVVVLQLKDCPKITMLDLHGLDCLRQLDIIDLPKLKTLIFTKCSDTATGSASVCQQQSVCSFPSLKFVELKDLWALERLPNFSLCLSLKRLQMTDCSTSLVESPCSCGKLVDGTKLPPCLTDDSPIIPSCESLEFLDVCWISHYDYGIKFMSTLTSLRELNIGFGSSYLSPQLPGLQSSSWVFPVHIEGLQYLSSLEKLHLIDLPIKRLPGLENLTNLRELKLLRTYWVEELPNLSRLTKLQDLTLENLTCLDQIHGLDRLEQLEYLDLRFCQDLTWLPNLSSLADLKVVLLNGCYKLKCGPSPALVESSVHLEGFSNLLNLSMYNGVVPPSTPKDCFVWMGPGSSKNKVLKDWGPWRDPQPPPFKWGSVYEMPVQESFGTSASSDEEIMLPVD